MFITAYLMVSFDFITSVSGAIIFLVGMFIECLVSIYKGDSLLRKELTSSRFSPISKSRYLKVLFSVDVLFSPANDSYSSYLYFIG